MSYLEELNPSQRKAVEYINGASLIIAGAGSGKTRVLTYKIAYLLEHGYNPYSLLSLTFTNKAAKEMKERIAGLVGENNIKGLWMGTFHSIFHRILQKEAHHLGYSNGFTIYDAADAKNLTKQIIKEMNLDDEHYKPNAVYSRISMAKNNLVTAEAYASDSKNINNDIGQKRPELHIIYRRYSQRLKRANAMDFDDLLVNTNILFRDFPAVLKVYQERFKFILVDEYQDTNYAQYLIVKRLSETHGKICVVGDDAQSIYSFRGAKIENILNFKTDYPNYELYRLEQNYRSTQNIVNAANSVIAKNEKQIKKNVFSKHKIGSLIRIEKLLTDHEEGFFVARSIRDMARQEGDQYSEYAVLYRTNAQSRILEESMRKLDLPYRVYGGLSFYQRKEVKDVIAYLRLLVNPIDEEALRRVINYPSRKIGSTTLSKLFKYSDDSGISIWEIINSPAKHPLGINEGTANRLFSFSNLIKTLSSQIELLNASDLIDIVITQTGIAAELAKDSGPQGISRVENVQELVSAAKAFVEQRLDENQEQSVDLVSYLENVSLLTNQDKDDDNKPKVTLMTIHSAKGLEFKNVVVTGLEENLFPGAMSVDSPKQLEEERRLFYVAITRAKENVLLTYCGSRFKYGSINYPESSRFLNDIDSQYVDWVVPEGQEKVDDREEKSLSSFSGNSSPKHRKIIKSKQVSPPVAKRITPDAASIKTYDAAVQLEQHEVMPGLHVAHARFGKGKVLSVEGVGKDKMAVVFFENIGQKKMLLKFARLRSIK